MPCYEQIVADETEDAIAAIAATAKQVRKPTPRWVWIFAGVLGIGCAIAFAVLMLASGDTSGPSASTVAAPTSRGFGAGLIIGLVAGIGIGIAIAQRSGATRGAAQRQRAVHSSRSRP